MSEILNTYQGSLTTLCLQGPAKTAGTKDEEKMNAHQFTDKVAVITGAGSGIGRALALNLAKRGAKPALSDIDAEGLAETVRLAEVLGANVKSDRPNVAERETVLVYADEVVAHFGKVNQVYNNAGIDHNGDVEKITFKDIERIMDVDFWGVVNGTKDFLPHLIASGDGHVVNISSLFGLIAIPGQSAYNAAKFAVRGFTEALTHVTERVTYTADSHGARRATQDFPHEGTLHFLDNQLDPATGTIRGRAIFRNADRRLTPGLFVRLRLPGTAQYARRPDPGPRRRHRSRQALRATSSAAGQDDRVPRRDARSARRRPARRAQRARRPATSSSSTACSGCGPACRSNRSCHGRCTSRGVVTQIGASPPREVRQHEFSTFFIDRPIFAAVLSLVILVAGALALLAAADQRVSRGRAADGRGARGVSRAPTRKSSPRPWPRRSSSRSTASRACSTCSRRRPPTAR